MHLSLFMNMIEHPEMFMNTKEIPTPNQKYYKYDSFSELMTSQKQVNTSLQHSVKLLEKMYLEQQYLQVSQWEEVADQLMQLTKNDEERTLFETKVMNRLVDLDEQRKQVEKILENEGQLKTEFKEQMNHMIATHEANLNEKLDSYNLSQDKLSLQLNEVHELQQNLVKKVTIQAEEQTNIKERLEDQEALMEKVSRQLTYFRSILFERTNDLAEKIEESYELTSAYLYKLLTGSVEPFSVFLTKQKEAEKTK